MYGLDVERVATANVEGKKKRNRVGGLYRKPDSKMAYVKLKAPVFIPEAAKPLVKEDAKTAKA